MHRISLWLLGLLAAALPAACASLPALQPQPPAAVEIVPTRPAPDAPVPATPAPVEETASTPPPLADGAAPAWSANAQTYRDEVVGFELRYPTGWDLVDVAPEVKQNSLNYAVTLNSWPRQEGSGGIPEGGAKLDIMVEKSAPANPADAAAIRRDQLAQDPTQPTVLDEAEITLGAGLPATRRQVQGQMGDSLEIVTATNGYTVLFSGWGDFALVEEIVKTMQPFQ